MSPAATDSSPRLFAVDALGSRSVEDLVLGALDDPSRVPCPVCDGQLRVAGGGVACDDCGMELAFGAEPSPAWVA